MDYVVIMDGKYLNIDDEGDFNLVTKKENAKRMTKQEATFIQNNLGGNATRYDS